MSPQGNIIKKRLTEDELESKRSTFKEAVHIIKSLKLKEEVEDRSFKTCPYLLEMTMVVLASLLSQPSKTKLKNKLNQNAREIIGDYSIAFKRPAKDVCSDAEGGKAQNLWKAVPSIHTFTRRYEALESVFKKHSQDTQGARTFSKEVKNKLFNEKKPCGICGKPIVDISHGEVDHIDPFSKGGPTTEDNAMLVHLLCNRQKGHK